MTGPHIRVRPRRASRFLYAAAGLIGLSTSGGGSTFGESPERP